jgi:hypothetical protein
MRGFGVPLAGPRLPVESFSVGLCGICGQRDPLNAEK